MSDRFFRVVVLAGVVGVWILVFQIAGLGRTLRTGPITVDGTVAIDKISTPVDVNLMQLVGNDLVASQQGMYIGVSSKDNTIIPIHWGEVSITR